jgi:hypothetical protein
MNETTAPRPPAGRASEEAMATQNWVTVGRKECEYIHLPVELREQRVYPTADLLRGFGAPYRVRACSCSAGVACNLAGIPCKWAFNAPDMDRF